MAKKKRNISLEEDILNKGLNKANQLGFTFSAYITYLINKDNSDVVEIVNNSNIKANDEEAATVDNDILDEVDNILGIG